MTVKATDSLGDTGTASGAINIAAPPPVAVQLPGGPSANGTVGTPYSITVTATGGVGPPYTFSISAGTGWW